ncbi:MAG: response regulator [Chitinispirillaceae bacterium]|nr:response regulator [Chitinispirillaceae bacterium]
MGAHALQLERNGRRVFDDQASGHRPVSKHSTPSRRTKRVRPYSVLVVDDEQVICQLLEAFFSSRNYITRCAYNGVEALTRIAEQEPDIVISDIRMPVMDGIELLRVVKEQYPRIKLVLMTGYNIDEYLTLIRKHNIGNILVKGPDFSLKEVDSYVKSILTGDIFGLERYFFQGQMHRLEVDSYARCQEVCSLILKECKGCDELFLQMAIDELISNAVFHGVLQLTGIPREYWRADITIAPRQMIKVTWASDAEKIGVSVEDPKGNLKKVDALRWLDQSDITGRENEEHGRGLYMVRRLIDRFIINIDPGKRTECIVIQYFNRDHLNHHKPLQIHEL